MRLFESLSRADHSEKMSVIVVSYNMRRELPRTLFSLSRCFQTEMRDVDYELIVMDNGSQNPIDQNEINGYDPKIRYMAMGEHSHPSPVKALNLGVQMAKGDILGFFIDGARMASPGLLHMAYHGIKLYQRTVVATLGWHLGPDTQMQSIKNGYSKEEEDRLLDEIEWKSNGYRLFDIASLGGSSQNGYFVPISESNAIFMRRSLFNELKGFNERFDLPGGGLVNLDFYRRACELTGTELVILLGEGTFHQIHGGIATNVYDENYMNKAFTQYRQINGTEFTAPGKQPVFLGKIPSNVMRFIDGSIAACGAESR